MRALRSIKRSFARNVGLSRSSQQDDSKDLLVAVTQNICKKKGNSVHFGADVPELPACQKFDFQPGTNASGKKSLQTADAFKAKLHELLSGGNRSMPIGVEYCYGVAKTGPDDYIINREFEQDINYLNTSAASENFSKNCGFHASAVIGQKRQADGKCYFELQVSEGQSCKGFQGSKTECDKNGHIWVDEDLLSRNMIRLSHF
jgi:hypothetical protein